MGVPVVSLRGDNFVSRMGASLLTAMNCAQWVADDEESYVEKAKSVATEIPALRRVRAELREELRCSPLGDIKAYTQSLEDLYETMWDDYEKGGHIR